MPFTDEDLKRLKEHSDCATPIRGEALDALLFRLEAAENYINGKEYWAGPGDWKNVLEDWRRAAGK